MEIKPYILLTGASSGIGAACAVQLSANYNLILAGRSKEKLEIIRQQCHNKNAHLLWVYDLTDKNNLALSLTAFLKENDIAIPFCCVQNMKLRLWCPNGVQKPKKAQKMRASRFIEKHAFTLVAEGGFEPPTFGL